ncbi:MAG: hypothetical protein AAF236_10270, partial [Verrucomicrobiota bacterium]
ISSALGSVTDAASAEAAVPKLEGAGETLSNLASKLDSLPAPIKDQITGKVGEFQGKFDELVGKVAAIPGVGSILQPHIDSISGHLSALSGQ